MVPINFIRIHLFNLFFILFLINIALSKPQEKYNTNIILNNKLINNVIGQEPYPYPDDRTDFTPEEIRKRIEEAEERKEEIEIQCQQKRIYAIALGVLSIFFLVLISIYTIFKCYLFCSSRTPLVRISKIGEVYMDEKYNMNKMRFTENSDDYNIPDDNNEAPTCIITAGNPTNTTNN